MHGVVHGFVMCCSLEVKRAQKNAQRENASTQNAPDGGHKETKTEPQEEDVDFDETFKPSATDKQIEPTNSPLVKAKETELTVSSRQEMLNALEDNLCFFVLRGNNPKSSQ